MFEFDTQPHLVFASLFQRNHWGTSISGLSGLLYYAQGQNTLQFSLTFWQEGIQNKAWHCQSVGLSVGLQISSDGVTIKQSYIPKHNAKYVCVNAIYSHDQTHPLGNTLPQHVVRVWPLMMVTQYRYFCPLNWLVARNLLIHCASPPGLVLWQSIKCSLWHYSDICLCLSWIPQCCDLWVTPQATHFLNLAAQLWLV